MKTLYERISPYLTLPYPAKTSHEGSGERLFICDAVVRAYLVQTYGKEVDMPGLELIP